MAVISSNQRFTDSRLFCMDQFYPMETLKLEFTLRMSPISFPTIRHLMSKRRYGGQLSIWWIVGLICFLLFWAQVGNNDMRLHSTFFPSHNSPDLCSLHGGMDRLAVSTIWTFSSDFKEVKSFWYGRTVIHNCQGKQKKCLNMMHDESSVTHFLVNTF